MNIRFVTGDLLASNEPVILHGVNNCGVMGAGIALAIKKKWPEVFNLYHDNYLDQTRRMVLGDIQPVMLDSWMETKTGTQLVINACTQRLNSSAAKARGEIPVSYDAIDRIFHTLDHMNLKTVAMPMIGAGLGGGNWKVIREIIEGRATTFEPIVYVLPEVSK